MEYHRKKYEYYKNILLSWKYKTTIDTREIEENVLRNIALKYEVHIDELKWPRRYKPLPQARSEAVKVFKDEFWLTFQRIATIIWQKNHTGILYLYGKNYDIRKNIKEVS